MRSTLIPLFLILSFATKAQPSLEIGSSLLGSAFSTSWSRPSLYSQALYKGEKQWVVGATIRIQPSSSLNPTEVDWGLILSKAIKLNDEKFEFMPGLKFSYLHTNFENQAYAYFGSINLQFRYTFKNRLGINLAHSTSYGYLYKEDLCPRCPRDVIEEEWGFSFAELLKFGLSYTFEPNTN